QRADVRATALGIGPADDHVLLSVEALGPHPDPEVAWRVVSIGSLGDGAFETKLAGLRAELRTVTSNVLAVAQAAYLFSEQTFQALLALDRWQLGGAHAIQEQKIEGEEDEFTCPSFIHRSLQTAE